ncbi:hypothetical protein SNK04_010661 [Fusarium graminearum]
MGTPHQGGNGVQLGRILTNVASVFVPADDRLLKHLERDSEWLLQQLGQYGPISGEFVTKFAYENYKTPIALGKQIMNLVAKTYKVVPKASAVVPGQADVEPIAIYANHKNMVKFPSKQDVGYNTILENLQIMVKEAEAVIRARWEAERRAENARGNEMQFSLGFSLSEVNEVNNFVARQEQLIQLQGILTASRDRRIVVIHGLGGMGKTQLAIAFTKQNHESFSAVFWMNATDEETLKRSFLRAADRILQDCFPFPYLAHAVADSDMDEIVKAVKRWLSERKNNQWLIIFDNYDHPSLGGNTDRRNSWQGIASPRKNPAAVDLAQELDGLPLALATAGAYLDQVAMSCTEYLKLYKESWGRLLESSPRLVSYEDRAMYSTWNISYQNVEKRNKSSAMLLRLWAYFDHDDLWYELLCGADESAPPWLQALTDKITFTESMRLLCDHGLVDTNTVTRKSEVGSPSYSVHGCVHAWMVGALHKQTDTEMVQLAARCVASLVPSTEDKEYWRIQQRLLQHVDRSFETMAESTGTPHFEPWINGAFGSLYADQGKIYKAEVMYDRALQGYEKAWGPEHTSTLDTVHNLGLLYADQGRLDKAEEMYDRALQGYEKAWGPEHTSTLNTVNNLGRLYANQGRLDKAEEMYDRALQGYEKAWGPEHTSTLDTVNNLGLLYADQGRLDKAEEMYDRALQGYEKAWGPEHTSTLDTVHNIGLLYADQGRLDKAEEMYDRALQGKEKAWGPEHTSTLDTVNNLGILYKSQGRLDKAEEMYERALQGYEKALGSPNFETYLPTLNTLENLGDFY